MQICFFVQIRLTKISSCSSFCFTALAEAGSRKLDLLQVAPVMRDKMGLLATVQLNNILCNHLNRLVIQLR